MVVSENQTNGKGTKGRKWYTKDKENLTFSFLLKPNCDVKKLNGITIMIARVIVDTIKDLYGYTLEIKYPNDIMKNGKKLRTVYSQKAIQ